MTVLFKKIGWGIKYWLPHQIKVWWGNCPTCRTYCALHGCIYLNLFVYVFNKLRVFSCIIFILQLIIDINRNSSCNLMWITYSIIINNKVSRFETESLTGNNICPARLSHSRLHCFVQRYVPISFANAAICKNTVRLKFII